MKIMLIIEDTEDGGVHINCYRQNRDGSLPDARQQTPANDIARAVERHIMAAKQRIDKHNEQQAARCWH